MNIKNLLAVNDLSGYGKASLSLVLPIVSVMGIQVSSIPSVVLSSHAGIDGFVMKPMDEMMEMTIKHWKKLNLKFDTVYTGFLSSDKQVQMVEKLIENVCKKGTLLVVDTVFADHGRLYSPFARINIVDSMKKLVKKADVITPNLTEACMLLGKEYRANISLNEAKHFLEKLLELNVKSPVITGVEIADRNDSVFTVFYDFTSSRYYFCSNKKVEGCFSGTGDTFASVLASCLTNGLTLTDAVKRAVSFTQKCLDDTLMLSADPLKGIVIEKSLCNLNNSIDNVEVYEL